MNNLLSRLEIIQNAIALGDEDIIALQAQRLPPAVSELANLLSQKEYGRAAAWIANYRRENLMPVSYQNPEVAALQLELAALEDELTELAAEKAEMESRIAEYTATYMEAVGPVLEELLQANQEQEETRAPDSEEAQRAREEYENFKEQRQPPPVQHLDDEAKDEQRQLYRKAAQKCHPDRLPEDKKEEGTAMFQQLEEAYRLQDIDRVREIWRQLEHGDWQTASTLLAAHGDVAALRRRVEQTRRSRDDLVAEIEAIRADESWQQITQLEADKVEWEAYFNELRGEMEKKLATMKQ